MGYVHVVTTVLHIPTEMPFIPQSYCECTEDEACFLVLTTIKQVSVPPGGGGAEQITGAGQYSTHSCLSLQYHYLSIV